MKSLSGLRALRLPALVLLGLAVSGCQDLLPKSGYDLASGYAKLAYRTKSDVTTAAAPNPPPVVAGAGGGGAAAVPQLDAASAPPGVTQAMVEEGAQHFGTVCTACHGPGGAGTPAGPALNDGEWMNISGSFDEIVATIRSGVAAPRQFPAPMPPMGGGNFNDEQLRALGAYVFALSHAGP